MSTYQPNLTTLGYLLNLPPTLYPISPTLSAAHLTRLRQLAQLPSSTTETLSCSKCSALLVPGQTSSVELRRSKKGRGINQGKEKERKKRFNRLKVECLLCGEVDIRPGSDRTVVESFPSSRKTRKRALEAPPVLSVPPLPQPPSRSNSATSVASKVSTLAKPCPFVPPSPLSTSPVLPSVPSKVTPSAPSSTNSSIATSASTTSSTSSARKKKKQPSALQKMLASSKVKEADTALKAAGGSLMDWLGDVV